MLSQESEPGNGIESKWTGKHIDICIMFRYLYDNGYQFSEQSRCIHKLSWCLSGNQYDKYFQPIYYTEKRERFSRMLLCIWKNVNSINNISLCREVG